MAPKPRGTTVAAPPKNAQTSFLPNPKSTNGVLVDQPTPPGGPAVNKKKQKRRQKEAQKAAAQQGQRDDESPAENPHLSNGHTLRETLSNVPSPSNLQYDDPKFVADQFGRNAGEYAYSEDENVYNYNPAYRDHHATKSKKKKKKAKANSGDTDSMTYKSPDSQSYASLPAPPISNDALRSVSRKIRNPMWETNSAEERRNIKNFWLNLPESERRKLVNIEKSHVLQKMKEQQKHSCSCTVCGRKRTAIEEELEVLYDAFHVDLENLVTWELNQLSDPEASRLQDPRIWADPTTNPPLPSSLQPHQPGRSRITELSDEGNGHEEMDDEDYSDDYDDDDEYSSDDADGMDHHGHPPHFAADFFQFGNSLTVKDGILTVADDLLKNDGQKFIDMMEQLAERRMQREEDARYGSHPYHGQPGMHSHNHSGHLLPEEDDYDDEEDPDDYSDEEEYEEEEDEMDGLTEDQRMEEGRRMFQIFAARMFEQRVVHAYKEQVAWERQQALMAEEEETAEGPSEAKKAKAAEKKKRQREKAREAKAQKEAQKEEERQRKEAAAREVEEKKKEEQRLKQEEARKRKEAEREALAEKKRKAEADAMRRREVERERQAEQERKVREQKAEEKRRKEAVEQKRRDEKEAREKHAREKKAQEDKGRHGRDAQSHTHQPAVPVSEPLSQPKSKEGRSEGQAAETQKRPSVPNAAVALPPSLRSRPSQNDSPQLKIATPALPKAPTPTRQKESSSRHTSGPQTPEKTPLPKQSNLSPTSQSAHPVQPPIMPPPRSMSQQGAFSQPQPMSPIRSVQPPPGMSHSGMPMGGMMQMGGYPGPGRPGALHHNAPGQPMPVYPPMLSQQRPFMPNNPPPSMASPNLQQQSQHQPRPFVPETASAFGQQIPISTPMLSQQIPATTRDPNPRHTRQPSTQIESPSSDAQTVPSTTAPIARPAPIGRPGSAKPSEDRARSRNTDVDDLSKHLGSSALLEDSDEPLPLSSTIDNRRPSAISGMPTPMSTGFGGSPFAEAFSPFNPHPRAGAAESWARGPLPPPTGGLGGQQIWGQPTGATPIWTGGPGPSPFSTGSTFASRQMAESRASSVRFFACQSCHILSRETEEAIKDKKPSIDGHGHSLNRDGWFDFADVADRTHTALRAMHIDPPVQAFEIEGVLDIPGNSVNGGGKLLSRRDENGRRLIKYTPDSPHPQSLGENLGSGPGLMQRGGAPGLGLGSIGSPLTEGRLPNLAGLGKF